MASTAKAEKANEIRAVPHAVPHVDRATVRKYNKSSQTIDCDLLEKRLKKTDLLEKRFKEEAIQHQPCRGSSSESVHFPEQLPQHCADCEAVQGRKRANQSLKSNSYFVKHEQYEAIAEVHEQS